MRQSSSVAFRASVLCFSGTTTEQKQTHFWEDGLLWIKNGKIQACGEASSVLQQLPANVRVETCRHRLIIPGFVDTHTHFPQIDIIGSGGETLLDWLNHYTFPAESRYQDTQYCHSSAQFFVQELLRNGITTAAVFGSVHPQSVDAFFHACQKLSLCMIAGKVLMDRHAPAQLCDTPESAYQQSHELIQRWHNQDRLRYAITPRFAPTSSALQLEMAGSLLSAHPDVYVHTHLSETKEEIQWVKRLFPDAKDYLDVYEQAGLLGNTSLFAHAIHLTPRELKRLQETEAAVLHCPSSNLFLGSGLFDLKAAQEKGIHIGLGTDVGGGNNFSLFRVMDDASKIQQLQRNPVDPEYWFYLATLGGAQALKLDHRIGRFEPGYDADFVILDLHATPLLKHRQRTCQSLPEQLSVLLSLGDDRLIDRTFVAGHCVYQKPNSHTNQS